MFKLVAVAVAALAGATIWKRRELAKGAERTSKALINAAQARRPVESEDEADDAAVSTSPASE